MPRKKTKKSTAKAVRPGWSGMLSVGLVTFPVQAFNAIAPNSQFSLHLLHRKCHSRIQYVKTCPVHGPVDSSEIVSAYEFKRGEYVEIEPEELDELASEKQRALTIDAFIRPDEIDPIYFDGRMYYLVPSGDEGQEAFSLFQAAMEKQERWGIGQVIMSGKQQLAAIRPYEHILLMAMLNYAAELRPLASVALHPARRQVNSRKIRLVDDLIKGWSENRFDYSEYTDHSREQLQALIEAKVEGHEVVAAEEEEAPDTVDLLEALRKSIGRKGAAHKPGPKLHRPSRAPRKHKRRTA